VSERHRLAEPFLSDVLEDGKRGGHLDSVGNLHSRVQRTATPTRSLTTQHMGGPFLAKSRSKPDPKTLKERLREWERFQRRRAQEAVRSGFAAGFRGEASPDGTEFLGEGSDRRRRLHSGQSQSDSGSATQSVQAADTDDARGLATYCQVFTHEGSRGFSRAQYRELVRNRSMYDMFIDGMTGEALCRRDKAKPGYAKLTPKELGILTDFVVAGKPMRPHSTKTGSDCLSVASARRLFETARKKVDVKLARYEYRAFRLRRNDADPTLNTFEFAPPDDLRYCVIVSV